MTTITEQQTGNIQQPTANSQHPGDGALGEHALPGDGALGEHALPRGMFIVRWRGYGVRFHFNLCGAVYSLVSEVEATVFGDQVEAARVSHQHHLRAVDIEILTVE